MLYTSALSGGLWEAATRTLHTMACHVRVVNPKSHHTNAAMHGEGRTYTVYSLGSRKDKNVFIDVLEQNSLQYRAGHAHLLPARSLFPKDASTNLYHFASFTQAHRVLVAAAVHNESYVNGLNDLYLVSNTAAETSRTRITHNNAGYPRVVCQSANKIAYVSQEQFMQGPEAFSRGSETVSYVPFGVYTHDLKTGKRTRLFQEQRGKRRDYIGGDVLGCVPKVHGFLYASGKPQGLFLLRDRSTPQLVLKQPPDGLGQNGLFAYRFQNKNSAHLTLRLTWFAATKRGRRILLYTVRTASIPLPLGYYHAAASPDSKKLALSRIEEKSQFQTLAVLDLRNLRIGFIGTLWQPCVQFDWVAGTSTLFWLQNDNHARSRLTLFPSRDVPLSSRRTSVWPRPAFPKLPLSVDVPCLWKQVAVEPQQ